MADGRKRAREIDYKEVPQHVIEDILAKLPVRSLVRFKCVSKQWVSMISNPGFIDLHLSNQQQKDPQLLLASKDSHYATGFSIQIFSGTTVPNIFNHLLAINNLPEDCYYMLHSCDGILCFYGLFNIHVINPSTREFRILPPGVLYSPHCDLTYPDPVFPGGYIHVGQWRSPRCQLAMGRDLVTKQYKIVKVFDPVVDEFWQASMCEIFTFDQNPNASWKSNGVVPYKIAMTATPVHVSGAIYWFTDDIYHVNKSEVIVTFDLHMEKFQPIPHPSCCSDPAKPRNTMQLGTLRGCLCLTEREDWQINIWLMTCERDTVTWQKLCSLLSPENGLGSSRYTIVEFKDGRFTMYEGGNFSVATPFTESLVPLDGWMLKFIHEPPQPW